MLLGSYNRSEFKKVNEKIEQKKLHIELQYLPPIDIIAKAEETGTLLVEANENYQKGGYRNKAFILSPNEYQLITIPLRSGKNAQTPIQEVEIAYDEDWVEQHLKAIHSAYGAAPYYEYYIDGLSEILERKHRYLWHLNIEILEWLHLQFKLSFQISLTDKWLKHSPYEDMRSQVKARAHSNVFEKQLIRSYGQVFEYKHGFRAGASSLDMLMCVGPESSQYFI